MSVSMKTTTARVALGTVLMGAVPMAPLVPTAIAQAIAQVIADPNAAAANRPTMHESLNKTPVQNIVAPNASGLSHNKLQEFNVDQRNLIINNSRVNAISNLGGAVVANPNLANGEARIILNLTVCLVRGMGVQTVLRQDPGYFTDMIEAWKAMLPQIVEGGAGDAMFGGPRFRAQDDAAGQEG